jgi:hypothetical protein
LYNKNDETELLFVTRKKEAGKGESSHTAFFQVTGKGKQIE